MEKKKKNNYINLFVFLLCFIFLYKKNINYKKIYNI